jgi:hypothetical protein
MRNPANRFLAAISTAVVSIGNPGEGGRGFVIELLEQRHDSVRVALPERLIITAAHCLPESPGPHPWVVDSGIWMLLAPLGKQPTIFVTCRFMDPVADIAVLGSPDDQLMPREAEAYKSLTKAAHALPIGILKPKFAAEVDTWLMSLDGRWFQCKTNYHLHDVLWTKAKQRIQGGMSGSPIVAANGAAIGVVSCFIKETGGGPKETEGGPHAQLCAHLPAWLLQRAYTKTTASRLTAEGKQGLRGLRDLNQDPSWVPPSS